MNHEKYELGASSTRLIYEFTSIGPNGNVKKIVQYEKMDKARGIYNCGFGDWDPISGTVDDSATTNNGDGPKVIATVIETIYFFTSRYSDKTVYFRGSDKRRTKIYAKIIIDYYAELVLDFEIFGITESDDGVRKVENFNKGRKETYDAYLIKRRSFGTI